MVPLQMNRVRAGQEGLGPHGYLPSARMEEGGRKAMLGRVADSTSLGRRLEPISPLSTHPSRSPGERVAVILPEGEPLPQLGSHSSQELRDIRVQTPWNFMDGQDCGGQGPPNIPRSLLSVTLVLLASFPWLMPIAPQP